MKHFLSNLTGASDWEGIIILSVLGLMAAVIAIGIVLFVIMIIIASIQSSIDNRRSTIQEMSGDIIDKKYIGEQITRGSGTAVIPNSDGGVGVGIVSTTSTTPEKFVFFIASDKVYKINVDMQQYFSFQIGDKINFKLKIGGVSKEVLEIFL